MNQKRALNQNFQQSSESYSAKDSYRYRQVLLNKVKNYWIAGVLEKSLHGKVLLKLNVEERLEAIAAPWGVGWETLEESRQALPPGTDIVDFFEHLGKGRSLLILGEAGSGKTTKLLQIARHFIDSAERDINSPIPVIFNLSSFSESLSWKNEGRSIYDWLVEELYVQYQIPRPTSHAWLRQQQLLLLLDGLDELAAENRNPCVEALNDFGRKYGVTERVVCSRREEYEILDERLRLQRAVYLLPLNWEQIKIYLQRDEKQIAELQESIAKDNSLFELVTTPLMLGIVATAYRKISSAESSQAKSELTVFKKQSRDRLFRAYVQRMLARKKNHQPYDREQTQYWLAELAERMSRSCQTIFQIDRLQPSWLQGNSQDKFGTIWGRKQKTKDYWLYAQGVKLITGSIWGAIVALALSVVGNSTEVMIGGIIAGLVGAALSEVEKIQPVETLKWSWANVKRWLPFGLLFGLSGFLSAGVSWGLLLGISGILTTGLIEKEAISTTVPNQGIWHSAKNALAFALSGGALCLVGGAGASGSLGLPYILSVSVFGSGIVGLILGLTKGGKACIQHLVLRFILYKKGIIPWNLAHFLNYASERNLLQKVGGGYIFVHRFLQEYFLMLGAERFEHQEVIDARDPGSYLRRANFLSGIGEFGEAITNYDRAIELDPDAIEAHAGRSLACYQSGDNRGALRDFERVMQLDPSLAQTLTYTGLRTVPVRPEVEGKIAASDRVAYLVTLLNDNVNAFDYVCKCLMKYIPDMNSERAWELTMKVHEEGQATIWAGDEQLAEIYRSQLTQAGLSLDLCWPDVGSPKS